MRNKDDPGHGLLQNKSPVGLVAEWHFWNDKIRFVTSRGKITVSSAKQFRRDTETEMRLRGIPVPIRG